MGNPIASHRRTSFVNKKAQPGLHIDYRKLNLITFYLWRTHYKHKFWQSNLSIWLLVVASKQHSCIHWNVDMYSWACYSKRFTRRGKIHWHIVRSVRERPSRINWWYFLSSFPITFSMEGNREHQQGRADKFFFIRLRLLFFLDEF